MLRILSRSALLACAVAVSVSAQSPSSALLLRYGSFDPLSGAIDVPSNLRGQQQHLLHIVQFHKTPTQLDRNAIAEVNGKVIGYLPTNAYVVRVNESEVKSLLKLESVRWVGDYHPAYRIDPELIEKRVWEQAGSARYNMVVADKHADKQALSQKIRDLGGEVADEHAGSLLFSAKLNGQQLLSVAGMDEVLWIDAWTPEEVDMDNARIQGGGNYVEAQAGYTGTGVNAHIYEGIEASHPDFTGTVTPVNSANTAQTHGHATGGIVFGNGNSNPAVRGMAPDAGKFFTNYNAVTTSRYQVFDDLVNVHNVSHTTASWGGARTFFYTSVSAESDDIVFDHDLAWTQSQSNAGNQDSRPQAWAKNVFSIGGVRHQDDSNPNNDSWSGGGSTGPASDGRIKPTLCAYYDSIGTSDRTGSAGYSAGSWTAGFGGTSGATPIVAGHNVIAIEMFTDDSATPGFGRFGNQLRAPGGTAHQNRPHFPTLKALQVVNARPYTFNASSTDNRREHQGWGFPNLEDMWDARARTFLVDEVDVLTQGQTRSWPIAVVAGEPSLKVSLNWSEPAANPAAAQHLVNNLSLRVTSPNGTVYWGNTGLESGLWSVAGGSEDTVNSIENVFVQNPAAGNWNVEVIATSIVADNHVETPAVDADYGLAVRGGTGTSVVFATFSTFGQGCPGSVNLPTTCPELNAGGGALTQDLRDNEYCYRVPNTGTLTVNSFQIWTGSTGGNVLVPAHIYPAAGGAPSATALASTTVQVGAAQGFYTATLSTPVNVTGDFYIGFDTIAQNIYVTTLTSGASGIGFYRDPVNGPTAWTQSGLVQNPAWIVNCTGPGTQLAPSIGNSGLPQLGSSYGVTLSDALANTFAVLASGFSDSTWSGGSLPAPLPGAPGCDLLVDPLVLDAVATGAAGAGNVSFNVPSSTSLVGFEVFHQWGVLDAVNAAGLVLSNAARASVGN
ncbi:MAG: S8 family serine peptidase [Planctomycetota bacterium]